jgi:hypothetical protein
VEKNKTETRLRSIFEVTIGSYTVMFRFENKDGSDAEVTFDGKTWISANHANEAISQFSNRFPTAFEDI